MAAENGTLTVRSLKTGITASVDVYAEDAATGVIRFNKQGIAGSASETFVTFSEPVQVVDFSIATGTTAVGVVLKLDGVATSTAIRYANYLNSIQQRPPLVLVIQAGQRLSGSEF